MTIVWSCRQVAMALAAACLGAGVLCPRAAAQDTTSAAGGALRDPRVDEVRDSAPTWSKQQEEMFAVPESPAFTFLNTSPAEIVRPSTWREFSVAVLSGVTSNGDAQQGFALEVAPFQIVPGFQVTLKDYQHNFFKRTAYRSQLSLGTVQAGGDSGSTDIALGIRIPLLDDGDLVQSAAYMRELGDSLLSCAPSGPGADLAASRACLQEKKQAVDSQYKKVLGLRDDWRTRRVIVAFALGNRLVNSSPSHREGLGWSAWALGSNPLGRWGMVIGSVAYAQRYDVPGSPGFSSLRYGGRAVVGSTGINGFLEVVGESRFDKSPGVDDGKTSWSTGLEIRLVQGMWLSTGFGRRYTEAKAPDRVVVLANVRWGLSAQPRGLDFSGGAGHE
ncbi:MAG TPA: hypothetical protein VFU03_04240 [Gemmatimonadales bacterium]|nr:hypothetical protein [Gemmatimonadales bacterium]